MKRLIYFVLSLALFIGSACTSSDTTPEAPATETAIITSDPALLAIMAAPATTYSISFGEAGMALQAANYAYAAPLVMMLVIGSSTADDSVRAVISAGGCIADPSLQTVSMEAPYVLCNHIPEGEVAKVRSRIDAAKNAEGKQHTACYVREANIAANVAEAVIIFFDSAYSGESHKYAGSSFLFNKTEIGRSTFMGVRRAKDAQLPGFVPAGGDPRCSDARGVMNLMIEEMRSLPGWNQ